MAGRCWASHAGNVEVAVEVCVHTGGKQCVGEVVQVFCPTFFSRHSRKFSKLTMGSDVSSCRTVSIDDLLDIGGVPQSPSRHTHMYKWPCGRTVSIRGGGGQRAQYSTQSAFLLISCRKVGTTYRFLLEGVI